MSNLFNRIRFLQFTLSGVFLFLSFTISSNSAVGAGTINEGAFDANGNYFDGTYLWAKITKNSIFSHDWPDFRDSPKLNYPLLEKKYCESFGKGWQYVGDSEIAVNFMKNARDNRKKFEEYGWYLGGNIMAYGNSGGVTFDEDLGTRIAICILKN